MSLLSLPSSEVHLWFDVIDPQDDDHRASAARAIVAESEWERCSRFAFPEGRRECLAARYLVRMVLSRYAPGVHPSEWHFEANAFGRPAVAAPAGFGHLCFNLSHADGVVACVVAAEREVGVDVERIGRRAPLGLAKSHFAPAEHAALWSMPEADRPRRFLEYWTLKEAYIKARGAGLSLPLDQFAFDLESPGRPRITFAPDFDDRPGAWQFDQRIVGTEHLVAIASRTGDGPPVTVVPMPFAPISRPDDTRLRSR